MNARLTAGMFSDPTRESALLQKIKREISHNGPMRLDRYMELALYDPQEGYYMTAPGIGQKSPGQSGDFTTAPEISQLFGEMIGLALVALWQDMGRPAVFDLIEYGPGRGTLMLDILRSFKVAPAILEAAQLHFIEISPTLTALQQQRLEAHHPELFARSRWSDRFDEAASDKNQPVLMVANEFFDALPARQFVIDQKGNRTERLIGLDGNGNLCWHNPDDGSDIKENGRIEDAPEAAQKLAGEMAGILARRGGAALLIDYGYDDSSHSLSGSLRALRGGKPVDPLGRPGSSDLSLHVGFSALVKAFDAAGLLCYGPVSQGQWLQAMGIETRLQRLCAGLDSSDGRVSRLRQGALRLMAPAEMGEIFKVLGVHSNKTAFFPGFD